MEGVAYLPILSGLPMVLSQATCGPAPHRRQSNIEERKKKKVDHQCKPKGHVMSVKLKAMFGAAKYQGKKIFLCLVYRKYKGKKKKC